jgi:hypothetical protein
MESKIYDPYRYSLGEIRVQAVLGLIDGPIYLTPCFFFKANVNARYRKEVVLKTIKSYTLKGPSMRISTPSFVRHRILSGCATFELDENNNFVTFDANFFCYFGESPACAQHAVTLRSKKISIK